MPCYDHRDSPSYIREHEIEPLQKRLDQYASWLCHILTANPTIMDGRDFPQELREWWQEHKDFDKVKSR